MSADILTTSAVGVAVAVVGFLLKKQFVDRSDRIEAKLDALTETVREMSTKNAEDHASALDARDDATRSYSESDALNLLKGA